jgi:hypothetical protein
VIDVVSKVRSVFGSKYNRTPLIRVNWDGEPSGYTEHPDMQNIRIYRTSGYAEHPDNWIFL